MNKHVKSGTISKRIMTHIHVRSDYSKRQDGTIIHYKVYKAIGGMYRQHCCRILLIMGFATSQERWSNVIHNLFKLDHDIEICTLDNRGSGQSSIPLNMNLYSTDIMARDVITVMDKIQWKCAHIVGFFTWRNDCL